MRVKIFGMVLLGFSLAANSANIVPFINAEGGLNLDISGEIAEGDDVILREIIGVAKSNTIGIDYISLNSIGGDYDAAVTMSYSIFSIKANTIVTDRSTCSNACFLLFSAGNKRILLPKAKVGVRKPLTVEDDQGQPVLNLSDVYGFYKLPQEIIYKMEGLSESKLYWLTKKEKKIFDAKTNDVNYQHLTAFKPSYSVKKNKGFSQYLNGLSYYFGVGVEQDYKKAFECFTAAAEDNIPQALHKLGVMFYSGRYVVKDIDYAEMLWNKSASLGYYPSLNNLSLVFEKANPKETIEINQRALESNTADLSTKGYAAYALATHYNEGIGVPVSKELAFDYYRQAALYGDSKGQYQYATILSDMGKRQEASMWFNVACSVGELNSCRVLRR